MKRYILPSIAFLLAAVLQLRAQVCVSDDFDPGIDLTQWGSVSGIASSSCGSVSGNALYFNNFSFREAVTNSLYIPLGGAINFSLKFGTGSSPCENADFNEYLRLEYSTNGGTTWDTVRTYNQDVYISSFTPISEIIPASAWSPSTIFRWRQNSHSGTGYDNWSLDDVSILCIPDTIPPLTDFVSDVSFTCNGMVNFTNLTIGLLDTAIWVYGDGTGDTVLGFGQVGHTYTSSGIYTVKLIGINFYGKDSTVKPNYITVSIGGGPVPAVCIPGTGSTCCGAGIRNVTLNTINKSSGPATEGYQDYSCTSGTTLFAGTSSPMYVTTDSVSATSVRAWIDFNNNGDFSASELVFATDSVVRNHADSVAVPATAAKNVALRMRVACAPTGLGAPPDCDTINYGQYEDYAVTVLDNPYPPAVNFSASPVTTCTGFTQFTDLSINIPTSWQWSFGDGGTGTQQNPSHTYAAGGNYNVTLSAFNANGGDTLVKSSYVKVTLGAAPKAPFCTPQTIYADCFQYGIYKVAMGTINQSSDCGSEGYRDYSCTQKDTLMEAYKTTVLVNTSPTNPQDTRIWVDLNNNGDFEDPSERLATADNLSNPSVKLMIPGLSAPYNTPLRMRVVSDYAGAAPGPCTPPLRGQAEDYTLVVTQNPNPPDAGFYGLPRTACLSNPVQFTDTSLNAISTWQWDFGDGNTSVKPNPQHYYALPGTYTVKLTVCGPFGCDSVTRAAYITIDSLCKYNMLKAGMTTVTDCEGMVYDDGGPTMNYSNSASGFFVIAPPNADTVTLTFSQFYLQTGYDYLYVYDAPDTVSTKLIGIYTGSSLPAAVKAPSGTMTLWLYSDWWTNYTGFTARWSCSGPPYADFTFNPSMTDTCNDEYRFFDLSNLPQSWSWDFGDGASSTVQHPSHAYSTSYTDSAFTVSLIVTNAQGSDTAVKTFKRYRIDAGYYIPGGDTVYLLAGGTAYFVDTSASYIHYWRWDFGDGTYSYQPYPSHTYDSVGNYPITLTVSNGVCTTQVVRPLIVQYTGIDEIDIQDGFAVYPNPTEGILHVHYPDNMTGKVYLRIFNIFGQLVAENRAAPGREMELDLSGLHKGVYIIRIEGEKTHLTGRLVIQ